MAKLRWRGDAQAYRDAWEVRLSNIGAYDKVTIECNRKTLIAQNGATVQAPNTFESSLYAQIAGAIGDYNNDSFLEYEEMGASLLAEDLSNPDLNTGVVIYGPLDGTPIDFTMVVSNGSIAIDIEKVIVGSPGLNEKWNVLPGSDSTGGSFTLTFGGNTTSSIPFGSAALGVKAALEALGSIGAGNVAVTAGSSGSYNVEFVGALASTVTAGITGSPAFTLIPNPFGITITEDRAASVTTNVKDVIVPLSLTATSGTVTLTVNSHSVGTTGNTASLFTTAGIQAMFDAVPTYSAGTFVVSENSSSPWYDPVGTGGLTTDIFSVECKGTLAGTNPTISFSVTGLDALFGDPVARIAAGTNGSNSAIYHQLRTATDGTYVVNLTDTSGTTTHTFNASDSAATIQSYYSGIGKTFTVTDSGDGRYIWSVDPQKYPYSSPAVNYYPIQITSQTASAGHLRLSPFQNRAGVIVTQRLFVVITGGPVAGNYALAYNGAVSDPIAYNANATAFSAGLNTIPALVGNVSASGNPGVGYFVTVNGALAGQSITLTADPSLLAGGDLTLTRTQVVTPPTTEVESMTIEPATGGTFKLAFEGQTTATIGSNPITAAHVQSALRALSNLGSSGVTVTGADDGPFTLTFGGSAANRAVQTVIAVDNDLIGVGDQILTITHIQTGTGNNYFDNAANWDSDTVPTDGDILIFENSDVPVKYGLETLSSVVFSAIYQRKNYTADIGLPTTNISGYIEYRPTMLKVKTDLLVIGEGDGSGSKMMRYDLQTHQTEILVYYTGQPDGNNQALIVNAVNSSNVLRVFKGSVGVATEKFSTSSQFATIQVTYLDSKESDAEVEIGPDVTVATIDQTGGKLFLACSVTTVTNLGGSVEVEGNDIDITTWTVKDSDVVYSSNGTIGTLFIDGTSSVNLTKDVRSKTISACNLERGATFLDRFGSATFTTGVGLLGGITVADVTFQAIANFHSA